MKAGELSGAYFARNSASWVVSAFDGFSVPHRQAVVFVVLSFGPYIGGGIRTEQVAVYSLLVVSLLRRIRIGGSSLKAGPLPILIPLALIVVVSLIASISPPIGIPYAMGGLLAALDNSLLPLGVIVLGWLWIQTGSRAHIVLNLAYSLAILVSINALLAYVQSLNSDRMAGLLRYFWTQDQIGSVAEIAFANLRFSGLFNQPAEAGLAYGIGLISCAYLIRAGVHRLPLLISLMAIMVGGGFLCGSKIFLLAVPLVAGGLVLGEKNRQRGVAAGVMLILTVVVVVYQFQLPEFVSRTWKFISDGSLGSVNALTAGRFGDSGDVVAGPLTFVLEHSPFVGFGIRYFGSGWSDSEWLRLVGSSGLLGASLYILVLGILALRLLLNRTRLNSSLRILSWNVLILVTISSIGIPVLSANRIGSVACMLLTLTVIVGIPASSSRRHFRPYEMYRL